MRSTFPILFGMFLVLAAALAVMTRVVEVPGFNSPSVRDGGTLAHFAGTIVVVPLLAAWATAEVLRLVRRPKSLDARTRTPITRLARGVAIGLLTLLLSTALLVLWENSVRDWLLTGAASVIATGSVLFFGGRVQRGCCPVCDHPLEGVTVAARGRCTECGFDLHEAQARARASSATVHG